MFFVVFVTINLNFNVLRKIFISTIPHTVLGFCSLKAPTNYLLQLTLGLLSWFVIFVSISEEVITDLNGQSH